MPRRNKKKTHGALKGTRVPSARIYSSAWGADGELHPVNRNKKVKWPTNVTTSIHPNGRLTRSVMTPEQAKQMKRALQEG